MSTSSTWDRRARILAALAVFLVVVVGVQGAIIYKVTHHHVTARQDVAANAPSPSPQIAKQTQSPSNPSSGALPKLLNMPPLRDNDAWAQIDQLHNRMDQLFADTFAQSPFNGVIVDNLGFNVPNLDLSDDKDHYTVRMDMPGADKSSIKVDVEGRLLSVSGQRDTSSETKSSNNQVIRSERSTAQFERTITLPTDVKADEVKADYANGVLTVSLPKAEKASNTTNVTVN